MRRAFVLLVVLSFLLLGCTNTIQNPPVQHNQLSETQSVTQNTTVSNNTQVEQTANSSPPSNVTNSTVPPENKTTYNLSKYSMSNLPVTAYASDAKKIGSDSAPVVVLEFSDLQNQFGRYFYTTAYQKVKKDYIDTNKVQLYYKSVTMPSFDPMANNASIAVGCAGNVSFEAIYSKLMDKQNELDTSNPSIVTFTNADLKEWLGEFNDVNKTNLDNCINLSAQVENNNNLHFQTEGFSGVPTFIIGLRNQRGYVLTGADQAKDMYVIIDSLLNQ